MTALPPPWPHVPLAEKTAPCGCTRFDGVIRHQRSVCTDPIVAQMNWYAEDRADYLGMALGDFLFSAMAEIECLDHHPVHDSDVGWLCTSCGSEAPPWQVAFGDRPAGESLDTDG